MLIIVLLSGMCMSLVAVAQRQSLRTVTLSVLSVTDRALREFRQEFGAYPYQADYPDLAAGGTWSNRLNHACGSVLSDAQRSTVAADMQTAAMAFSYNLNASDGMVEGVQPSPVTYTAALTSADPCQAAAANRIGAERARLAVLSGNVHQHGPRILNADGTVVMDKSALTVLGTAQSAAEPGWASDYLTGQLPAAQLQGDAILDAYHHPLVYINQCLPGVRGTVFCILGNDVVPPDTRLWGEGTEGFDGTTGPAPALVAAGRGLLLQNGRIRISHSDAGDGAPTPADPTYFPDPTRPLHSDVRYYSAPGYEAEFELWSAGPDGIFTWMRDDPGNHDNLALLPYDQGLSP